MTDNTPQDSQSDAEKIVNEILRRHDHQQDAHELDVSLIEAYVTTRVKEAERLARIDELEQMSHINFVASTVVPRVSTDNRNPVKRMSDHINERLEAERNKLKEGKDE